MTARPFAIKDYGWKMEGFGCNMLLYGISEAGKWLVFYISFCCISWFEGTVCQSYLYALEYSLIYQASCSMDIMQWANSINQGLHSGPLFCSSLLLSMISLDKEMLSANAYELVTKAGWQLKFLHIYLSMARLLIKTWRLAYVWKKQLISWSKICCYECD
jgi:hypothetical protein